MSTRVMLIVVEIDDDVSQDDEFETLMGDVEDVAKAYIDPAIKRVLVMEGWAKEYERVTEPHDSDRKPS